jgi:predicted nucleotidyltransferase
MSLTFPSPTSGNLLDRFDSFVYSVTKAVADQKDADPTACIPDALVITKLKQHLPKELQDYIVQLTSENKTKDSATFIKEMRIKIDTKQSLTKDTAANVRSQHEKGEHSKKRTLLSQYIEEERLPSHLREEVKVFLASTFKPN